MFKRQTMCNKQTLGRQSPEAGQTILEFALTLMITLLLFFGMIDFSRVVYAASVIQAAAQEGARAGIVDAGTAEAAARGRLTALDADAAEITLTVPADRDEPFIVEIMYPFEFIAPIIAQLVGNTIELRAEASMVAQ